MTFRESGRHAGRDQTKDAEPRHKDALAQEAITEGQAIAAERLTLFTDAVIAIAIAITALALPIPDG